jgi:hypothetical protein
VQHDIQQRVVNLQPAVVVDEAQLASLKKFGDGISVYQPPVPLANAGPNNLEGGCRACGIFVRKANHPAHAFELPRSAVRTFRQVHQDAGSLSNVQLQGRDHVREDDTHARSADVGRGSLHFLEVPVRGGNRASEAQQVALSASPFNGSRNGSRNGGRREHTQE